VVLVVWFRAGAGQKNSVEHSVHLFPGCALIAADSR